MATTCSLCHVITLSLCLFFSSLLLFFYFDKKIGENYFINKIKYFNVVFFDINFFIALIYLYGTLLDYGRFIV